MVNMSAMTKMWWNWCNCVDRWRNNCGHTWMR